MHEDHLRHESLIPSRTATVLDIGCGRGGNAAWLNGKGIKVDAVSWNPDDLTAAKQFCRRVIQCDLNEGLPHIQTETYDGIICSHILEHIAYPDPLLKDIERALVPEGFLLVIIPNLFFWSDRVKLMLGQWDYEDSGTFDYTHLRWYTIGSIQRLLSEYGFVADRFIADGWIPLPGVRFLLGTHLRNRINDIACRVSPSLFGKQLIFRFRKHHAKQGAGSGEHGVGATGWSLTQGVGSKEQSAKA